MDVRAEIKRVASGIEIHLFGSDAARIDKTGLQGFLYSRLACSQKNSCRAGDSIETKVKCLTNLLEHKFLKRSPATQGDDVIRLDGATLEFATQERIDRLVQTFAACRDKNRCTQKQNPVERWACVNTLAQQILRR
jgi:hypothetical protein